MWSRIAAVTTVLGVLAAGVWCLHKEFDQRVKCHAFDGYKVEVAGEFDAQAKARKIDNITMQLFYLTEKKARLLERLRHKPGDEYLQMELQDTINQIDRKEVLLRELSD